jgi:hypothetical protein
MTPREFITRLVKAIIGSSRLLLLLNVRESLNIALCSFSVHSLRTYISSFRRPPSSTWLQDVLENPGIALLFRIQTVSLKVLDLKFKVLDTIIWRYKPENNSQLNKK